MLAATETAMPGVGLSIPQVVEREATPDLAIKASGAMRDLPQFAPPLFGETHAWMLANGVMPGLHIFRYRRFGNDGSVELDVGNIVDRPVTAGGKVVADELPAGRHAVATYTGPYDRLYDAFCMLNGWINARGLKPDAGSGPDGYSLACQLEIYRVSPRETDNPSKFETDIMIKLA